MVDLKIKLPNGFLDEEIRCNHLVTKKMKEIWAVELDLLAEFQRVCDKHGIKYFASGGTLLGTVRHKGFIPWDDDLDIEMFREDYQKLCKIGPKEFKYPYVFQNEYTESGSGIGSSKLRNCQTTARYKLEKGKYFRGYNKGIFIDIFPLDCIIDDAVLQKKKMKKVKLYSKLFTNATDIYYDRISLYNKYGLYKTPFIKFKILLRPILYYPSKWFRRFLYRKYEEACSIGNSIGSKQVAIYKFYNKRTIHDRNDYLNTSEEDFEFLKLPIPSNYVNWLNKAFGNWHEYVKGTSYHGENDLIFDTDSSFTG